MFNKRIPLALVLIAVSLMGIAYAQTAAPTASDTHTIEYANDIKAFEDAYKKNPPSPGGILFIGSSIFRQWTELPKQMAPLPVFNRAFGGSRTWEVLHYMDRIVLPYKPRIVVYYCGSNDINGSETADAIVSRIAAFERKLHAALPETEMYFVSVNRAPQKQDRWGIVDSVNEGMRLLASKNPRLHFIDVNPALFDAEGKPVIRLYQPDHLHFHPEAYERFTAIVRPEIEKAWKKVKDKPVK